MSRNSFSPRLRDEGAIDIAKFPTEGTECACCEKKPTHWVRISETHMRGEDDFYDICQRHLSMAHENIEKFFAHMRTKNKFLKRPEAS